VYPPAPGAHSWQPMSYNPNTGLVYIPVFEAAEVIGINRSTTGPSKATDDSFEGYYAIPGRDFNAKAAEAQSGKKFPSFNPVDPKTGHSITRSLLKAWNPVTQQEVWVQPVSEDYESMEGGVMSSAGNLVFKGNSLGELRIYAADSGKLVHTLATGTAMMAAPSTYMVDGVQYVAIMAGFGGDAIGSPPPPKSAPAHYDNWGRILAFRLGGTPAVPRTAKRFVPPVLEPPPQTGSPADIAQGGKLFGRRCSACHSGGILPDLRTVPARTRDLALFKRIVLEGLLATQGMQRFDDVLTPHEVEQIHAYLIDQAQQRYDKDRANKH
jgi:quinohemoprotein ethanol dehydrogenase